MHQTHVLPANGNKVQAQYKDEAKLSDLIFSCDKGLLCNRTSGKTYEVATQSIYGYFVCIKMCYDMQYTHLKIACENIVVLSDCLTLLFKAIPQPSVHEELSLNIKLLFLCE